MPIVKAGIGSETVSRFFSASEIEMMMVVDFLVV